MARHKEPKHPVEDEEREQAIPFEEPVRKAAPISQPQQQMADPVAEAKAADIAYHQAVLAAGLAHGSTSVAGAIYALKSLGQHGLPPLESAPTTPVIDSIEPATAPEGTLVLVVTGRNFSAASVICYGDVNQDTTVSTDLTQLTATFESGPPGIYDVNVHDPAGDANTVTFEVT